MKRDGCRVKICGITCPEDRELVYRAGADYFGVIIDVPYSPRRLSIEAAADLFKNAPLPGVALVFQRNKEQIIQIVEHCRPQVVQFLSPMLLESLYELKRSFPIISWWQSLFLSPAGTVSQADLNNLQQQLRELAGAGADAVMLDTVVKTSAGMRFGGTGQASDWELARSLLEDSPLPVFLAGGINPSNVRKAMEMVHPDGIDLCSGVEAEPGRKDPKKLFELLGEIRKWEKENTERMR